MINTLSKINLSKIGWEGGGSTSIWIMSLDILFVFFDGTPKKYGMPRRAYWKHILTDREIGASMNLYCKGLS